MNGTDLPSIHTPVPGPRSQAWVDRLATRECPAITARRTRRSEALSRVGVQDQADPIVWAEALGSNVKDVDDNLFIDLTAGFGVASTGHRNPRVVEAARRQAGTLLHAMGDAFPDPNRVRLLERLAALTGLDRAILGSSGSDAVEAAIKTARMATGRDGILAFSSGYHGLSFGVLAASDYLHDWVREPFKGQLGRHVRHAPYGGPLPSVEELADVGGVLVEPVQGRGGMRVPPDEWLRALRERAHAAGALFMLDEIYTGFGRTGAWFRYQAVGELQPDVVCIGKGMSAGFPISACVGTAAVMDAWGASTGASIHTQTFLGHPVGEAMALANIDELERVIPGVEPMGAWLSGQLRDRGLSVRGVGLMLAVEVPEPLAVSRELLRRGFIALPAGEDRAAPPGMASGMALGITPPLTITQGQLQAFLEALDEVLA